MVVVGPWAPRPAGGDGQPLLASLLCIDFCCSALPWRLLAGGDEFSAHPPHLPLSWLGWPSVPTLPQLWLAPAVSPGPLHAAPGPQEEGSQRAHGDPQLCSPALGSPASNHLLELLLSFSPSFHPSTHSALSFSSSTASSSSSCHCTQTTRDREGEKQVNLNFQNCLHSECQSGSLISEQVRGKETGIPPQ